MAEPWSTVRLGAVLNLDLDRVPVDPATTYPMVGVLSFGRGFFDRESVSNGKTSYRVFYRLKPNHVVMSQLFGWEGALALSAPKFAGKFLSPQFPTFICDTTRLDREFLGWFIRRRAFWEDLAKRASGMGDRRRTLSPDALLACEIPLPPLAEQRRLVSRIEALATQINEARALRQQTTAETEALVGARSAELFRDTGDRGVVPLKSLAILERGKFSHRPRHDPRFFGGSHPWIQIAEIESAEKVIRRWTATLNDQGLAISKKFTKGTVLISIAATIGSVGILDFDCCVPDSIVAVTPRDGTDSEFLYHYLRSLRSRLEEIAPQSAQKNINLQILASLPVPKLSPAEQRRIVLELDGLQVHVDAMMRLQSETAAAIDTLLPAVLDRAFRGEL